MPPIGVGFLAFALATAGRALGVRGAREFVFHLAAELVDARGRGAAVRGRRGGIVVVGALGFDVGVAGDAVDAFDLAALDRRERAHVLVVVVGVVPDGAGRVVGGVDEELVVELWVVLTDPAVGEGASFVFHGATALGRDAVSGAVRRVVGDGALGVGWWWIGCRHGDGREVWNVWFGI